MKRYDVRCDMCKRTIKRTDNVVESYQGGLCSGCKLKIKIKIPTSKL